MSTTTTTTTSPLAQAFARAGLMAYAQAFDDAGYDSLDDLGTDESEARTAIAAVVPADKPGIVNRILGLWKTAHPADKPPREAPALPDLPAGTTLDLTRSTVEVDGVEYALPSSVETSTSVNEYGPAEWMIVAKRTRILFGVDLDVALSSDVDDSARADRPALVWSVPEGDDYLDGQQTALVTSTMSYTSSSANLVHNRITDASISVSVPFVSVAARVAREERQASDEQHKRLFMTGMWRYQQATLKLSQCTVPSPAFVGELTAAVGLPAEQRFEALRKVFARYGHAVSRTVTLGGQLYFQSERNTTGKLNENDVKTTVQAAVSAKVGAVGGGASASFADGEGSKVASTDIAEAVSFTCVGGDTTLGSNPKEWASTAKDPSKWAVIGRNGLVALVDLIDPALKAQVVAAWQAGVRTLWGNLTPPAGFVTPPFDNQPFTITTMPLSYRSAGRDAQALLVKRLTGFSECVSGASSAWLADPVGHNLLWKLIYSGRTTQANGTGAPIYWLAGCAANGTPVLLAAALPNPDFSSSPNQLPRFQLQFMDLTEMSTNGTSPEVSAATWTVARTDPSGYYGDLYDAAYVFRNVKTGNLLGPLYWNDVGSLLHPAHAAKSTFGVIGDPGQPDDTLIWRCQPVTL